MKRIPALQYPPLADALTGFATGKRTKRRQDIYTPQPVIDLCLKVWPEGIALDPCTDSKAPKFAEQWYAYPNYDGLTLPWVSRAYINPPFRDLKKWLAWGDSQPGEQIWLIPVRTHRPWWLKFARESSAICWVNGKFTFLGYDDVFPAPLSLIYRGERVEQFRDAARLFGDVDGIDPAPGGAS